MSPSSTYHHHNDVMTHLPPSDPKTIRGRFPEASPKPHQHPSGRPNAMGAVSSCIVASRHGRGVHISCLGINGQSASQADIDRREVDIISSNASKASMADIEAATKHEKWTSLPRMQTSQRKKFTSEPSRLRRYAQTKGIGANRHRIKRVDLESVPTRGTIAIIIIFLHQLASLHQLFLHQCTASSDFKLRLLWVHHLWVHQRNPLTAPASLLPLLA